jgi:uncharacterized protein YndB with AHSA1/START domain
MSTTTTISTDQPIITMTRVYDAPRDLVWDAMTKPEHIREWWGGAGTENPVCEMDVRPGGLWKHVMRFSNGFELKLDFVFLEVEAPGRLVWQHTDHGKRQEGPPTSVTTVNLEEVGSQTRWTMVARFNSMKERDAAINMGFSRPIEASSDRLTEYLPTLKH